MKKYIKLYLITFLINFISCNTTDPPLDDNVQPGRRDYEWSIDSVDYDDLPGRFEIRSIWGSSPDDVWAAGFTADVRDCFWHYDGKKWSRAVWNTPITTGGDGSKQVGGVWGTARDDVWAFGGKSFSNPERNEPFIMHFDGSRWTEVTGDKTQMANGFIDIYAIAKDHFWIAAYEEVYHYLNGTWKKYFIGEKYYVQSIEGIEGSIFLTAYPIGTDSLYLMRLNGSNFNIIDKTKIKNHKFGPNALQFTNSKIYTFGIGIISSRISGTEINLENWNIETRPTTGGFSNSLLISSKDIWAVGINSNPHHYNGSNWKEINIFNESNLAEHHFYGIWGNGSEIFISDIDNSKIYHGK